MSGVTFYWIGAGLVISGNNVENFLSFSSLLEACCDHILKRCLYNYAAKKNNKKKGSKQDAL